MYESAEDDRIKRKVYLNGFTAGTLIEADLIDYFGLLFGGHVRQAWIDRKFGTHALIEFDEEEWAKKAVEQKKHPVVEDEVTVFAWTATKGTFTKRGRKRGRSESTVDDEDGKSMASSSSGWGSAKLKEIDRTSKKSIRSIRESNESMGMTDEERSRREKLREELEKRIVDVGIWPVGTKLELFGSSVNGFGWRYSDIDLTLLVENGDQNGGDQSITNDLHRLTIQEYGRLDPKAKLELMASCLREIDVHQISDVVQIHGRRCPVVRFSYRSDQIGPWNRCEISIENEHAVKNTKWLMGINRKYGWLVELFSMFRWWIGQWRGLEKARKELNGYTIALIIVSWCQKRGLIEVNADVDLDVDKELIPRIDDESLSAIFNEFLSTWHRIHWKQTVYTPAINPSEEPILSLLDFLHSNRYNAQFQFSAINVQDPFDQTHNTANHVSEETVKKLARASEMWTKRLESQGSERVWKIFEEMDVESGEESMFVFVCEPTADILMALARLEDYGTKSVENRGTEESLTMSTPQNPSLITRNSHIGSEWCNLAVRAILAIFSDVLKLRTAEEGLEKFYCLAWNATWLMDKRKRIMQTLLESNEFEIGVRSRFELERKITEMLIEEEGKGKKKKKQVEPVGEFSLVVSVVKEEGFQEVRGRLEGDKHVAVFGRFLTEFVHLVFEDAVRRVMSEVSDG